MASGYEVLGANQPPVSQTLLKAAQLRQQQQQQQAEMAQKQQEIDLRKQMFDEQNTKDLLDETANSSYATGLPSYDTYIDQQLPAIQQNALKINKQQGWDAAEAYIRGATRNLATLHQLIGQKVQNEMTAIQQLKKQNPYIDADALGNAVLNKLNGSFAIDNNGNAIMPGLNFMSNDIAGSLAPEYGTGADGLINTLAKTKPTDFEKASHNGLGGGYTTKYRTNPYTLIDPKGNPAIYTEDVPFNPNDPNSKRFSVLDSNRYNLLLNSTPHGDFQMNTLYRKAIKDPGNPIYTDPSSPYYKMTPQQLAVQHPVSEDYGKRWLAKQLVSQIAPARILSTAQQADHEYKWNSGVAQPTAKERSEAAFESGLSSVSVSSPAGARLSAYPTDVQKKILEDVNVLHQNTYEDDNGNTKTKRYYADDLDVRPNKDGTYSVYPKHDALKLTPVNPLMTVGSKKSTSPATPKPNPKPNDSHIIDLRKKYGY